jgi:hypothetical protein
MHLLHAPFSREGGQSLLNRNNAEGYLTYLYVIRFIHLRPTERLWALSSLVILSSAALEQLEWNFGVAEWDKDAYTYGSFL